MASVVFTTEERIRELLAINDDVPDMIKQAGQALNALTNRPLEKGDDEDGDAAMADDQHTATADDRQEAFKQHAAAFYMSIQSITARLRRSVYALEEAGIITPALTAEEEKAQQKYDQERVNSIGKNVKLKKPDAAEITNGGLGNLDVGWLNSRSNKVGAEKDNELMKEARELLEGELGRREAT